MRLRFLVLAIAGVVVASSACSVDATSPLLSSPQNGPSFSRGSSPDAHADQQSRRELDDRQSAEGTDSSSYRFTIDPSRDNVLRFGPHALTLPAHSVCGLSSSGYGLGLWDEKCKSEKQPLTITIGVTSAPGGLPRIDLGPKMRFNPKSAVVLAVHVPHATERLASHWRVLYCPTTRAAECIDESLRDPSLATQLDRRASLLLRRIKHFSGYLVAE
jgi:hypothetical protein